MSVVEMSRIDLEQEGHRRSLAGSNVSADCSLCFSDVEEGSCHSQFFSTTGGSYDEHRFGFVSEAEVGIVSDSDCCSVKVEIGSGAAGVKVHSEKVERDCRICHLGLESDGSECGIAIELGCCCKDDLAAAHKQCAEAWFRIKGNKTCEICHAIARNVTGAHDIEPTEQSNESNNAISMSTSGAPVAAAAAGARNFLQGHRVLNFLLACMVFAFVISWLFHFNVPS